MLTIFYSDRNQSTVDEKSVRSLFPQIIQDELNRYTRDDVAQAALHGKLLLLAGLTHLGFPASTINGYQRNNYGRPYLSSFPFDFNISHSGNLVMILFSDKKIGLDIEEIRAVPLEDFDRVFSKQELTYIGHNLNNFFQLWTIKEGVMKADGRGFGLDPRKISIDLINRQAKSGTQVWHYRTIDIDNRYIITAVSANPFNGEQIATAKVEGASTDTFFKNIKINLKWL